MVVLPEALRAQLAAAPVFVSASGAPIPERIDLSVVRQAIRDELAKTAI
jgi:predicted DNA-binding transcriptional regulator YafY